MRKVALFRSCKKKKKKKGRKKEFGRKKYLPSPLRIMYSSYWYLLTFSIAGSWIGNRTRNKTVQPTGNSTQNHILAVFESGFRNLLDPDSESIF